MFKKIVISANEIEKDILISQRHIEKIKKNIKVKVNEKYLAVIFRDNVVSEVLKMGNYKPFTKQDEKQQNAKLIFVSTEKSKLFPFATRQSQTIDIRTKNVYNISFTGRYSFSVRNERKLLGTYNIRKSDLTFDDFVEDIKMEVNNIILPYIISFFTSTSNSIQEYNHLKKRVEEYVIKLLDKYLDDTYGINVRELNLNDIKLASQFSM